MGIQSDKKFLSNKSSNWHPKWRKILTFAKKKSLCAKSSQKKSNFSKCNAWTVKTHYIRKSKFFLRLLSINKQTVFLTLAYTLKLSRPTNSQLMFSKKTLVSITILSLDLMFLTSRNSKLYFLIQEMKKLKNKDRSNWNNHKLISKMLLSS